MHTFEGNTIRIMHHGDYRGQCTIFDKITEVGMTIDSEDLLKYAAEYIRSKKIEELEILKWNDILR